MEINNQEIVFVNDMYKGRIYFDSTLNKWVRAIDYTLQEQDFVKLMQKDSEMECKVIRWIARFVFRVLKENDFIIKKTAPNGDSNDNKTVGI